ncbi:hypothetical protein D3C84_705560 [compost metagenome]
MGLPAREMRATSWTSGKFDSFNCGIMASASPSSTVAGKSATVRRLAASGAGGPEVARAKMNTLSPGWTLALSSGERSTRTLSTAATLATSASVTLPPLATSFSLARAIPPCSAARELSSGGNCASRRFQ